MSYGVRYKKPGQTVWRRARTTRNPRGVWKSKAKAEFIVRKLTARGIKAHSFALPEPPVKYPTRTHYSEHFSRAELNCKGTDAPGDCGCNRKNPSRAKQRKLAALARDLEKMRKALGGKLGITSGYRCDVHNRYVDGAIDSQHRKATAADLAVPNGEQQEYVAAAETVPAFRNGGIGIYPNGGVHVDRRGWRARWSSWVGSR